MLKAVITPPLTFLGVGRRGILFKSYMTNLLELQCIIHIISFSKRMQEVSEDERMI